MSKIKLLFISILALILLFEIGSAQTLPDEPLDIEITGITYYRQAAGVYNVYPTGHILYSDSLETDTFVTCDLLVNGNFFGTDTIKITKLLGLCDCVLQTDHPTCNASCAPLNADCYRYVWGILDFCTCDISWNSSFKNVSFTGGDTILARVDYYNMIDEWNETNNEVTVIIEIKPIPTLTQWGLMIVVIMVISSGIWLMLKRKRAVRV